jgi:hypothetical protein
VHGAGNNATLGASTIASGSIASVTLPGTAPRIADQSSSAINES